MQLGQIQSWGPGGMCFYQGKGFPEAMPTAPAIPGPIPSPFKGVAFWGRGAGWVHDHGLGMPPCLAMGCETSEVQCGGQGFFFFLVFFFLFPVYFIIGFLVGNHRKDHKEQPQVVSEVKNRRETPFTAINTAAKISKPCPGDREDPSKNLSPAPGLFIFWG